MGSEAQGEVPTELQGEDGQAQGDDGAAELRSPSGEEEDRQQVEDHLVVQGREPYLKWTAIQDVYR